MSPRVLVVDDDAEIVKLLQLYLKAEGLRTIGADSGQRALDVLDDGDVALVILDVRMPHMDGFEVCRRIRANPACARLPVVFLTAEFKDAASEVDGLEAGAVEYLHKPIPRRALVARVRNLLRLADAERDRKILAQMAQSEKFAAVGQVAAGVAHEINNPLACVLSNLGSLRSYVSDLRSVIEAYRRGPEQGRAREEEINMTEVLNDLEDVLRDTEDGGRRVGRIVKELKAFSRQGDQALEPVDLAETAASTLVLTEREIEKRARLTKILTSAPITMAPKGRLNQVVLNLVVNAIQALDDRGPNANEIRIETRTEGDFSVLSVADTGCGIPQEHLDRLFEPFFTTKPIGVGTGIGLSVCATTIKQLGGSIDVQSVRGKGSTFTVRVPRAA